MGNQKSKASIVIDDDFDSGNHSVELGEFDSSMESSVQEWTGNKLPSQISTPMPSAHDKPMDYSSSDSETECGKPSSSQKHKSIDRPNEQPPLKKSKTDASVIKNGICHGDENSNIFLGKFNFM